MLNEEKIIGTAENILSLKTIKNMAETIAKMLGIKTSSNISKRTIFVDILLLLVIIEIAKNLIISPPLCVGEIFDKNWEENHIAKLFLNPKFSLRTINLKDAIIREAIIANNDSNTRLRLAFNSILRSTLRINT